MKKSSPLRIIRYWWFEVKFKWIARFIVRHKLWWNSDDKERWEHWIDKNKLFFNPYIINK